MAKKPALNLTTLIGVVLAVAVAASLMVFLSGFDSGVTIYVAADDIASNRQITTDMLAAKTVDEESIPAGAIISTSAIVGRYTVDRLYRGEAFTSSRLAAENESGTGIMITQLPPDSRLMSVQANVAAALAGRIRSGDIVDVIAVFDNLNQDAVIDPTTGQPIVTDTPIPIGPWSQTVIQQAFVSDVNLPESALQQAASRSVEEGGSSMSAQNPAETSNPIVPGIYTLMVTPQQAQLLALAVKSGTLYLVLTPGASATPYVATPTETKDIVTSGAVGPRPVVTSSTGSAPATTTTTPAGAVDLGG